MRSSRSRAGVSPVFIVALVVVASAGRIAAQDLTGRWTGSYAETVSCGTNTGAIELIVNQSGSQVFGILKIDDVERNAECEIEDRIILPLPASGATTGAAFTLNVQGPSSGSTITGTISGNTVNLGSGGSFTANLTRINSSPPDIRFNGTYYGSYLATFGVCGGSTTATSSGAVTLTIFQAGSDAAGFVTTSNTKKDKCRYTGDPPTLTDARVVNVGIEGRYFAGLVNGDTLSGFVLYNQNNDQHLEDEPFTATLNGPTLDGSGESLSFQATRGSSALSPAVLRFGAESQTIAPGESVTLEWNVFNAASVSIDNGIGNQPPAGSVTLRPATTTTYRLTAVGSNDTMTVESTTFAVTKGPKRRGARH